MCIRDRHVTEQAVPFFSHISFGVVQLELDFLGYEGVAVDLAMGMGHRHPHHVAAVLNDTNILDVFVRGDGLIPFHPEVDEFLNMGGGELRQGDGMLGGIEDHLAFSVSRRRLKEIRRHRIGNGRGLRQGGKIFIVFIDIEMVRDLAGSRCV